MKKQCLVLLTGLLGLVAMTASAGETKVVNSIQGRNGIHVAVIQVPEKVTVALSKQGQGVGTESKSETRTAWHNPSRTLVGVTSSTDRE